MLRGGLSNETRLPDVVGERLLAIDVLAMRQRQVGGKRVRVLGGADDKGVDIVGLAKDLAKVPELPRRRKR